MSFDIEGKMHKIFPEETKGESFKVREFVIETDGQYPQYVKFQLTQDRCAAVEPYKEGDMIKVSFDLRGREWNEKYFTNLNAWKIDKVGVAEAGTNSSLPAEPPMELGNDTDSTIADDLPF